MDTSVTSIEAMAREFGETLFERGFSKGIFHEFRPYQTTDVLLATHAVIGVVLNCPTSSCVRQTGVLD